VVIVPPVVAVFSRRRPVRVPEFARQEIPTVVVHD
jgi:hypothetical protein